MFLCDVWIKDRSYVSFSFWKGRLTETFSVRASTSCALLWRNMKADRGRATLTEERLQTLQFHHCFHSRRRRSRRRRRCRWLPEPPTISYISADTKKATASRRSLHFHGWGEREIKMAAPAAAWARPDHRCLLTFSHASTSLSKFRQEGWKLALFRSPDPQKTHERERESVTMALWKRC